MNERSHSIVLVGSALWCLTIISAPGLQLGEIYSFFAMICHQNPERSWHIAGSPLPVCVRCASIYFGFLMGVVTRFPAREKFFKLAVIGTVIEIVLARVLVDSEMLRAATGFVAGVTTAPLVVRGFGEMLHKLAPGFRRHAV